MEHWLEEQRTPQLVFVRYSARHNVNFEWVYNRADLLHAPVLWARDLGAEHDQLLLRQFPERTAWLIEADRPNAQLVPFSQASNTSGTASQIPHVDPDD
jgi:hypothetical protein